MRDYKFRAGWYLGTDSYCKTEFGLGEDYFKLSGADGVYSKGLYLKNADYIVQFTGLLDKSDVEIYEGDIVRYEWWDDSCDGNGLVLLGSHEGPVVFDGGMAGDHAEVAVKVFGWFFDGEPLHGGDNIEVIGNIYETPELL